MLEALALVLAGDVVALMGDSQAFLLKRHLERYVTQVGASLQTEIEPGSSLISWGKEHDEHWANLRKRKAQVVIVVLGSNDVCSGLYFESVAPLVTRFFTRLAGLSFRDLYFVGPPLLGRAAWASRQDAFARRLEQEPLVFLDSRTASVGLWNDGLHPNEAGQVSWAKWIWEQVSYAHTSR